MDLNWNSTTLNYTLLGKHYKDGQKVWTLKHVVADPDPTLVDQIGQTLASLGVGDTLGDSEIVTRQSVVTSSAE
ncbi:hypothetical protein FC83_GL000571 [Agrilactobacillus composti DSM 18527 = JCM 14202]|uniref:DUF1659 domain-containing protein n=1 Tax=Agrilactobacillus composti DSM 18527 = JCM 14202 TaxID=1423734 RepID=X0PH17_9LACO|nr:hypothetical protein [Agrilactobacillus composti]KRM31888.1 hypothetical protein FC83_GL000571 [Agrilactobacillus composti DSM 18527 = JCM 14202]GAF41253.1 hypothetical protein JCM14202_3182 [Agrilactobacillus composti DSM 18527 = JCM 14202]